MAATEERYRERFRPMADAPEGEGWELEGLSDDGTVLEVRLAGGLRLTWRDPVAYRVIDEGVRLRQQPLLAAAGDSLVYAVEQSVFLEELWRLSNDVLREQALTHYVVWTLHQCVDVVAASPPLAHQG